MVGQRGEAGGQVRHVVFQNRLIAGLHQAVVVRLLQAEFAHCDRMLLETVLAVKTQLIARAFDHLVAVVHHTAALFLRIDQLLLGAAFCRRKFREARRARILRTGSDRRWTLVAMGRL